jgi:thiamine pyrophosphokinase
LARAVLFLGGDADDTEACRRFFRRGDVFFCADSGAGFARSLGIVPRVIIGDFDSIDQDDAAYFASAGSEFMKYPPQKDMTDAELALGIIVDEGFDVVMVFGWRGGRTDHMMGNIALLERFAGRARIELCSPVERIFQIGSSSVITDKVGTTISFFALSSKVRITLRGFAYPLDNALLKRGSSLCISNVITAKRAKITVSGPVLAVIEEVM